MALGYFIPKKIWVEESYIPPVSIIGDTENIFKIDKDIYNQYGVQKDFAGSTRVINMKEVVSLAGPVSSSFSLYIIASDGRTAVLSGNQLKNSYIGYSNLNGWEAFNPSHPISSNIKDISEIIIVSDGEEGDFGLNIITMEDNIVRITPGSAYLEACRYLEFSGTSYKDLEGERFETSTFQEKYIIGLKEITDIQPETMILMGSNGEYEFLKDNNSTFFELDGNRFSYNGSSGGEPISDLKGAVLNPSAASIMDVYYDAGNMIKNGSDVLLIITDGMGYHQYEYAIENGYAPFLESIKKAEMALSAYQPVTNTGLAAMFTGRPPSENGIYSRNQRVPEVPTIWGEVLEEGRSGFLIEGDIQIIKTEIEASLNSDRNSDGTIDDEIFEAALDNLDSDAALITVHFHSIDDSGHDTGDLSQETMERIRVIDTYIEELVSGWQGKVIITSDHGMHPISGGGNHGEFRYEDMVVPYLIINGGKL